MKRKLGTYYCYYGAFQPFSYEEKQTELLKQVEELQKKIHLLEQAKQYSKRPVLEDFSVVYSFEEVASYNDKEQTGDGYGISEELYFFDVITDKGKLPILISADTPFESHCDPEHAQYGLHVPIMNKTCLQLIVNALSGKFDFSHTSLRLVDENGHVTGEPLIGSMPEPPKVEETDSSESIEDLFGTFHWE